MSCKQNKTKQNCGTILYGVCVRYEGGVSANSSLTAGCLNLEETTQDIYDQLDEIEDKLDVSELGSDCITFIEPRTLSSVIQQMYDKLCELEGIVAYQESLIITLQGQVDELQQNPCS